MGTRPEAAESSARVCCRWALIVDLGASGIASADVEGYLGESDVAGVLEDYLLVESDHDANVVLHVIPDEQYPYPDSRLRLAADLAEYRGPPHHLPVRQRSETWPCREEGRADELLHELALERKAAEG